MQCIKVRIHQDSKLDKIDSKISKRTTLVCKEKKDNGEKEKTIQEIMWERAKLSNIHAIKTVLCFDFRQT